MNSRLAQLRWRLNLSARAGIRRNSRLDRLRLRLVLDDDDCLYCGQLTTDQLALAARTLLADARSRGRLRRMCRMRADRRMVRHLEIGGIFIVPAGFRYCRC